MGDAAITPESVRQPPSDAFRILPTQVVVFDGEDDQCDPSARSGVTMPFDEAIKVYGAFTVASHLEAQAAKLRDRHHGRRR